MKDLARKIDSMRQFGYVLLTPKEAKRVSIELRRVELLEKQKEKLIDRCCESWDEGYRQGQKNAKEGFFQ